jgi:hypothetical protein
MLKKLLLIAALGLSIQTSFSYQYYDDVNKMVMAVPDTINPILLDQKWSVECVTNQVIMKFRNRLSELYKAKAQYNNYMATVQSATSHTRNKFGARNIDLSDVYNKMKKIDQEIELNVGNIARMKIAFINRLNKEYIDNIKRRHPNEIVPYNVRSR